MKDFSQEIILSGKTKNGKFIIKSVFCFYNRDGIPLDIVFEFLKNNNCIPDWISFVKEAMATGMRFDRVISLLDSSIADSYGPEFRNVVIENLTKVFLPKE